MTSTGYPAQRISEVLPFQIAPGGFKQGVPNFSGGKASLQEQDATGLSKWHGEREQEQAAIRTRLSLSAKSTTLNIWNVGKYEARAWFQEHL